MYSQKTGFWPLVLETDLILVVSQTELKTYLYLLLAGVDLGRGCLSQPDPPTPRVRSKMQIKICIFFYLFLGCILC